MTLYLDLDGVLANFDKAAMECLGTDNIYKYEFVWGSQKFWQKIKARPNFFADLEVMPGAVELFNAVAHLNPVILTALPNTGFEDVAKQKMLWGQVEFGCRVITCETLEKPQFCRAGDILIDDRAVNRDAWLRKGGTYIIHTTAERTIGTLKALGIID